MIKINLFDESFRGSFSVLGYDSSSDGQESKYLNWQRDNLNFDGITIFTDHYIGSSIVDSVDSDIKIAWLIEPRCIIPWMYETIINFEHKFDYIFTHDVELLKRNPKYVKTLYGSTYLKEEERKIYPKSKNLSIIVSDKKYAPGHLLRHEIVKEIKEKNISCDVFGRGYNPIKSKLKALKDYKYSIVIINDKVDNFFTEALIDCLLCGTIPIFWGCPNLCEYFNTSNMLIFNTKEELFEILNKLDNVEFTQEQKEQNFEMAKKYTSPEDLIYHNFELLNINIQKDFKQNWIKDIWKAPKIKKYSQNGEEGYIKYILDNIGYGDRFLVDIGAWDSIHLSNSKYFIENFEFNSLLLDGDNHGNSAVKEEWITAENICSIFEKYNVPKNLSFLNIDIDGNEYYVLDSILNKYRPNLIVSEINGEFSEEKCITIEYNPGHTWGHDNYYGVSYGAIKKLGEKHGYRIIFQNDSLNVYLVRKELIEDQEEFYINFLPIKYHKDNLIGKWINV